MTKDIKVSAQTPQLQMTAHISAYYVRKQLLLSQYSQIVSLNKCAITYQQNELKKPLMSLG